MLDRPAPPKQPVDRKALRRARNRRYRDRLRQRLKKQLVLFTGEADDVAINWMVQHGYLTRAEADDADTLPVSVGRAISALIKVSSR